MKRLISIFTAMLFLSVLSGCSNSAAENGERGTDELLDSLPSEEAVTVSETGSISEELSVSESQPISETISETEQLSETENETVTDISLRASSTEILIGTDDSEIIWYAEIPIDCEPEKVELIDADTGDIAAELFDEADFEKYGDTIKGDSVYNCRFTVDTDIDTDPDVSEERYYHYYVRFTENGVTHCSETVEIWVLEQFSDKELYDMEAVEDAIDELRSSEGFEDLSVEEKTEQITALLRELAENGTPDRPYSLLKAESICVSEDMISFEYACGVSGGVKLTPFDKYLN